MYVCKFETEKNIKQMELTDYFGKPRTVEFDMNNPDDIKKAIQVLTPKTRKKAQRRKKGQAETENLAKSAKKHTKFQDVLQLIPHDNTTPKTEAKTKNGSKNTIKPKKISKITKKAQQKPSNKHSVMKKSDSSDETPSETTILPPITSPTPISKPIVLEHDKSAPNQKENTNISSPNLDKNPFKSQKPTTLPSAPVVTKPSLTSFFNSPKPMQSKSTLGSPSLTIPEEFIASLGMGGDLEISCPLCAELTYFKMNDLDRAIPAATRQCDNCGAFLRISIRLFNQTIFRDLKFPLDVIQRHLVKKITELEDEEHNPIYVYSLQLNEKKK